MGNRIIKYLERHSVSGELLPERTVVPDMVVVIPCYDEPDIFQTLESLRLAKIEGFVVEVIVVVNSGELTPVSIIKQNHNTYRILLDEAKNWHSELLLTPVLIENVRRKHAGVGYARKVGMDLAVKRFSESECQDGIIVSLDADAKVAANYFEEINKAFKANPKCYGVIVKFEHEIAGDAYSEDVYEAIMHYELHLRYINQALRYAQFPYVYHTVGSAFAVRASVYVAHGGMNRRQGGEDFYFLHKLFPNGYFVELNTTTVFPSPRPSHRVPFGTGPQVKEYLKGHELLTYNWDAFVELKAFIIKVPDLYRSQVCFTPTIEAFLTSIDFAHHLDEIRRNAASQSAFIKRFFAFFDAFKVIKFLNFAHQKVYSKNNVVKEAQRLLRLLVSDTVSNDVRELLEFYRNIEGK